ncbi:hypothetical protein ACIRON_24055 [Nocardioides sp. NPDC101246]|uniref:hypothetical protein n=1 Tax=Nocardioides sp. NPDC101246 TaxID=3364336 RepID=UPI003823DCC3
MIVLAAEPTSSTGVSGILVVIIVLGVIWLMQDLSKKSRARSERLRAKRSLTATQRKLLRKIDRAAKSGNGSTKELNGQFGAFKGNPKAFSKEAAALHKAYKASKTSKKK